MTKIVRLRRGTSFEHLSGDGFTGALAEVTVDTTNDTLRIHDGTTKGGHELVGVDATQILKNKTLIGPEINNPTVTGVSTFSSDVEVDANVICQEVIATDVVSEQLNASISNIGQLDIGPPSINPGSDLFVSGTTIVSDSISIGSSSSLDYRFFASNIDPNSPVGEIEFTVPGTYTWTAPVGVTSVSAVCVGGGGGGLQLTYYGSSSGAGGGGLAWKNNIAVIPGQSYTVVVGSGGTVVTDTTFENPVQSGTGGTSYFIDTSVVAAYGGTGGISESNLSGVGGTYFGNGGGNGGKGGRASFIGASMIAGSGGAGGYTGVGGTGGEVQTTSGKSGSGGAAGGGAATSQADTVSLAGGAGGGVGLYGEGISGTSVTGGGFGAANPGKGGSGGSNANNTNILTGSGLYGGGGRSGSVSYTAYSGGSGAVRLVWGPDRNFPTSNVEKSLPTDVFNYTTSGRVGIGTTNPSRKLEVIGGDIRVGVNTSHGIILTASNGSKYRLLVNTNGTLTTTFVT